MGSLSVFRNIRARLAVLIVLAMTALVIMLVYQQIRERQRQRDDGEENLQRLATFAAHAERERFDAAERLLTLALQSQPLRTAALSPDDQTAFDACTRTLFVLDQLLPETSGFALWDPSGNVLCSSEAAKRGEFSAASNLWFQTARERKAFATGGYELSPPDDEPSIGFGIPIRDADGKNIIAYLSTGLSLNETDDLLAGTNLPETGRLGIIDQNGVIINSTSGRSGEHVEDWPQAYGNLSNYLDGHISHGGNDRTRAAVRITDAEDAAVTVIVAADDDVLAPPLTELLAEELAPVLIVTLLTLLAAWFLANRWFLRPIGALVRASDSLAAGRLGARASVPGGVTEFDQLGAAFNEMASTREQASQAKDEFLGLVSHELKTPITTVVGNAEILSRRGDKLDNEQRQSAMEDIHESGLRLAAIIDNLLALARLERGVGLESEPLAMLRMAQAAAQEELRRAPGRRVLVRGDGTVLALAGETHVGQVLSNLVGNAIKYSPPDDAVEVEVSGDATSATVRVLDRGQGVAEGEQDLVFQPFYRSDRTAGVAEGIGIGLSVCKRLIEAMDGEIWCRPRDGGGSEFGFRLPRVRVEAQDVAEEAPAEERAAVPSV